MSRRNSVVAALGLAACVSLALVAAGCGEKIAIPHAEGLFSVSRWLEDDQFADDGALQIAEASEALFVLSAHGLAKRDLAYGDGPALDGFSDAAAVCVDTVGEDVVFVWDQGTHELKWFSVSDLTPLGSSVLPTIQSVRAMATNTAGIEQVPAARTFIYFADPDSGVVHRFAFDNFNGPMENGILTRSLGDGARSVHEPWGMATDASGRMVVCDADTLRNWVIRFDSTPDLEDTAPAGQSAPLRGKADPFEITCPEPAPADYVLGDAATCGQTDWVGGPSNEPGFFRAPRAVGVDGSGRIFVADTGNNRVSMFTPAGYYVLQFGDATSCPAPSSLAIVDKRGPDGAWNYAAYVFVVTPGSGTVRRFISAEHYLDVNGEPPPRP